VREGNCQCEYEIYAEDKLEKLKTNRVFRACLIHNRHEIDASPEVREKIW